MAKTVIHLPDNEAFDWISQHNSYREQETRDERCVVAHAVVFQKIALAEASECDVAGDAKHQYDHSRDCQANVRHFVPAMLRRILHRLVHQEAGVVAHVRERHDADCFRDSTSD